MSSDFSDNSFLPLLICLLKISTCHLKRTICAETCAVRKEFPLFKHNEFIDWAEMKTIGI